MNRFAICLLLLLVVSAEGPAASGPCRDSLSQCPKRGCAQPNTPQAFLNSAKRNLKPKGELKRLSFDDFRSLQDQAESLFSGHYHTLTKPDRVRLRQLQIGGQTVGEGDWVEIIGYIAIKPPNSKPHPNTSGESVNCRLTGTENNDFHISLTPGSGQSEYEGIVVEMVPQKRNEKWTVGRVREVQQQRRQVRVRGQLFFDNHHYVNDAEALGLSNQPKRMSLWEVHPVTEFDVCTLPSCGPNGSGWKPLGE